MRIHHVGNVVADIEAALAVYRGLYDDTEIYGPGIDPIQKAEIAFVRPRSGGEWIELLRPTADDSPLARSAARGGGLHHLAYAVPDVRRAVAESHGRGALVVLEPTPAAAFGGLEIAFVFLRHAHLVELVDRRATPPFVAGAALSE